VPHRKFWSLAPAFVKTVPVSVRKFRYSPEVPVTHRKFRLVQLVHTFTFEKTILGFV
jgi:hypothetical protein